ncbi:MAG: response regulator [Rhodospirillaceae bacterium]|nr:response regulator [Rhodospirillaceae bacterium]
MKVYIIDDDWDIIQFMTTLLEAAGHTVYSGVSAVSNLPKVAARRPDCVLIDLMMAEMDGLTLAQELHGKAELAKTKLIMVTSKDHQHWQNQATEAGVHGYITKPLDPETFVGKIEKIVSQ